MPRANEDRDDFYVYIIFNEFGCPIYVGKGRGSRWKHHEWGAKHIIDPDRRHFLKKAPCLDIALADMLRRGLSIPRVKVAEGLSNFFALHVEREFIKAIGIRPNGPLFNKTLASFV